MQGRVQRIASREIAVARQEHPTADAIRFAKRVRDEMEGRVAQAVCPKALQNSRAVRWYQNVELAKQIAKRSASFDRSVNCPVQVRKEERVLVESPIGYLPNGVVALACILSLISSALLPCCWNGNAYQLYVPTVRSLRLHRRVTRAGLVMCWWFESRAVVMALSKSW